MDPVDSDEDPVVAEVESDPDFVEFEVTDLGGRIDKDREERKGRRPRSRRRSRGEDSSSAAKSDEPAVA